MRQDLTQRFERESNSLETFCEAHLAKVNRWVYSVEELWSCFEMCEKAPEDLALPGPEGAFYAYGFDESERRILVREFRQESKWLVTNSQGPGSPPQLQRIPTKEVFRECLITYEGDSAGISIIEDASLKAVYQRRFKDGLLMEDEQFDYGFYKRALFYYEGRRKKKEQHFSDHERLVREVHYGPHGEQS